jgi:hypothetical protein
MCLNAFSRVSNTLFMEASRMREPYPNDPPGVRPTDMLPQNVERMEELQPKPAPPPPAAPVVESIPEESAEIRQEEARTFRYAIGKLNDFLQWFITVLEVTLLIRFVLKLIGADPTNLFAGFLYALTDIILFPFNSIVRTPSIHQNQAFEWSTLIAMIIYWLVFWMIRRFLRILITGPEDTSA